MNIVTNSTSNFFIEGEEAIVTITNAPKWAVWDLWNWNNERVAQGRIDTTKGQYGQRISLGDFLHAGTYQFKVFNAGELLAPPVLIVVAQDTAPDKRFGVNTAAGKFVSDHKQDYQALGLAGRLCGKVRDSCRWEFLEEPAPRPEHLPIVNSVTDPIARAGCSTLLTLGLGNPGITDYSTVNITAPDGAVLQYRLGTPHTDFHIGHWKRYVETVLLASRGQVEAVAVYNEPDQSYMADLPPHRRAETCKKLVQATREVVDLLGYPVKVIAGEHAKLDWNTMASWKEAGVYDVAHAVSFHHYPKTHEAFSLETLKRLKDLFPDKELWCTEYGFLSRPLTRGWPERDQAYLVAKSGVLMAAGGLDRVYYYGLANLGESVDRPNDRHRHFGLVRSTPEYQPKLALAAYAQMARELAGMKYVCEDSLFPNLFRHRFCSDDEKVDVFWADSKVTDGPNNRVDHKEARLVFDFDEGSTPYVRAFDGTDLSKGSDVFLSGGNLIYVRGDYDFECVS